MKKIFFALILMIFVNGCAVTEEIVTDINQQIEDRYNSFSTLKYDITESRYENGALTQTLKRTEMLKKPDKIIQFYSVDGNRDSLFVCNENTVLSQITLDLINVYEYVNLLPEMTTYCGYFIEQGLERWKIPLKITDTTKYDAKTSIVEYNGNDAIKAVVTVLMEDLAKQKQIAIGNTPRETVITYWFDIDSFAILKEEYQSYSTECESSASITGGSSQENCVEIENKVERIYEGFYFDEEIADSEFEIDYSDYVSTVFEKEIVDVQGKFDD